MYVIARDREWTIAGQREDDSIWEVKVPAFGSRPARVPARDAERLRQSIMAGGWGDIREANAKGEPLTPFPPKTSPPSKVRPVAMGPAARFEDLRGRLPGADVVAALERDQEMSDWYLNDLYEAIASFHVPPVSYPPDRFPDGSTRARTPLQPRAPATPAAVLRWIREWERDLRATLKETGAPIDRVPTDGGRTLDYTLTKWGLENIRRAPLWRRDEAILRREREEAKRSQVTASRSQDARTADYRRWKLWLSRLAKDAGIKLGEKRGATPGVEGIRRKRASKVDHVLPLARISSQYGNGDLTAAEILQKEGFKIPDTVRLRRLLSETARQAAAAAEIKLIGRTSLEDVKRGSRIIAARLIREIRRTARS